METFSALLELYAENSSVTGEFPSQRPVTRSFDSCAWINNWVNSREAGDLRRHRAYYGVIVMSASMCSTSKIGQHDVLIAVMNISILEKATTL